MNFTPDALALLKRLEGCRLEAYRDFGEGRWTVGYGHTGSDVHQGVAWTQEQADGVLDDDVTRFCLGVERMLSKPPPLPRALTDNQFSCLVVFAFNVGLMALDGSTAMRRVRLGMLADVPGELLRWNKVHDRSGVPMESPILTQRRKAEVVLWNMPMGVA